MSTQLKAHLRQKGGEPMNVRKPIDYSTMFQSIGERRVYIYFTHEDVMTLISYGNAKLILRRMVMPP